MLIVFLLSIFAEENLHRSSIEFFLWKNREQIHEMGEKYDIPATALAGVFLAEHSLHVHFDDHLQNLFSRVHVFDGYRIDFSIGAGQIKLSTAQRVDYLVARMENRECFSIQQVQQTIQTDLGSIQYAAAILYEAKITYQEHGIDIGERPEILATVYNIGVQKEQIKKHKKHGTQPKANAFGRFVLQNEDKITRLITME